MTLFKTRPLRGELRSHPIRGALIGAILGLGFAVLELLRTNTWPPHLFAGHLLGFAVGGLIIGALFPLMKQRVAAGVVVWAGTSCGILVAGRLWWGTFQVSLSMFVGFCFGLIYAVLLWAYEPGDGPEQEEEKR